MSLTTIVAGKQLIRAVQGATAELLVNLGAIRVFTTKSGRVSGIFSRSLSYAEVS